MCAERLLSNTTIDICQALLIKILQSSCPLSKCLATWRIRFTKWAHWLEDMSHTVHGPWRAGFHQYRGRFDLESTAFLTQIQSLSSSVSYALGRRLLRQLLCNYEADILAVQEIPRYLVAKVNNGAQISLYNGQICVAKPFTDSHRH